MNGQCGSTFKPFVSSCECCNGYERCMKLYQEYIEQEEKMNNQQRPLRTYEEDIIKNRKQFRGLKAITGREVEEFTESLSLIRIDQMIKFFELYKED